MTSVWGLKLGLAMIALAIFWHLTVAPYWKVRFHDGWSLEFNFIGIGTLPDPATGRFPAVDSTSVYQRLFRAVEHHADAVILQDDYIMRDPATGEIIYALTFRAAVDPVSGAHLDPQYQGEYYLFPREVQKTTYRLRHAYLEGLPMSFQMEDEIEGINTYLFSYHGPVEYTGSYVEMQDSFPLMGEIGAGQEIRCADDQFRIDMWVEPVTGALLKINESCYAGDYVVDAATGETIFPVMRWGGVTAGDDVQARSDATRVQRTRYLWATRFFPLLLLVCGLASLLSFAHSRLVQRSSLDAQAA